MEKFTECLADIIKRAYQFTRKRKIEGLPVLENDLDANKLAQKDIFEFGIRLAADGVNSEYIEKILSNMIEQEKDEKIIRLKKMQKEAVLCIRDGITAYLLLNRLMSYITDDENNDVLALLEDTDFFVLL